uniref:t-SNARE coiled-coil homology domain-containing protein n=1 Tax=Manihot esculenta TaxID=3983 RepID=A0A2C9UCW7_MANES
MSYRRDIRNSRSAIFDDGLEEGGLRASSSYSHSINEHDNDKAIDSLQDRVIFLKRLTGDIHEEVESHNRLLDRMVCLHVFSSSNSPENNLWPFI